MPATAKITKRSTMEEVLEAYPSAQRAWFRRFHIGGIDAWSLDVDSSVPRYAIAPDPGHGKATLRPLRSIVSQAAGCQK